MKSISVKNIEQFSQLFIPQERTDLSEAVIDVIEENLNTSKDIINDIQVSITDYDAMIIISIKRHEFLSILEEQLEFFEEIEEYRTCARIVKMIKNIKAGSIVQSLINKK